MRFVLFIFLEIIVSGLIAAVINSALSVLFLIFTCTALTALLYFRRNIAVEKIRNNVSESGAEIRIGNAVRYLDKNIVFKLLLIITAVIMTQGIALLSIAVIAFIKLLSDSGKIKDQAEYKELYDQYYLECIDDLEEKSKKADAIRAAFEQHKIQVEADYEKKLDELEKKMKEAQARYDEEKLRLTEQFDKNKASFISDKVVELMDERDRKIEDRNNEVKKLSDQIEEIEDEIAADNQKIDEGKRQIELTDSDIQRAMEQIDSEINRRNDDINRGIQELIDKKDDDLRRIDAKIDRINIERKESQSRIESDANREEEQSKRDIEKGFEELFSKLDKDGWNDICKFDFRKAWPIVHGLTTNIIGWPANLDKMGDGDIHELEVEVIKKLLKELDPEAKKYKPERITAEKAKFMPDHISYDVEKWVPDCEDSQVIISKLSEKLGSIEEFKKHPYKEFKDKTERIGFKEAPHETLYSLKLIETGEQPVLFIYNFGDMGLASNEKAHLLRDFVMKHTVFLPFRFLHDADEVSIRKIITTAGARADFINLNVNSAIENRHQLNESIVGDDDMSEINNILQEIAVDCEKNTENKESFFEYALDRANARVGRFDHKYKIISICYPDLAKIKDNLNVVMRHAKYKKYGIYIMIFVDEFKLLKKERGDEKQRDELSEITNQIKEFGKVYRLEENDGKIKMEEK